jgi:lipopolysaccharide transport system ATP-binding protein
MSEEVIVARGLSKTYRLYARPHYRLLDLFGLLPAGGGRYTEHQALKNVDLDVRRGEKIAIIGRNGAGKSTLLKLVTQVIEPTSGSIEVAGRVHALLQIGSGFHADFTGRENVYAYLAQLGVTGREADERFREIVEFAELEEYAEQPLKTYSTGMTVRLMFSTTTAITPDVLVLDEVLGVGDAYFAHKSYERIRALAEGAGTTLLLVTHDLYSAAAICERVIWIDRGEVLMDGGPTEVIRAYEDSVRAQEERRLRRRKLAALHGEGEGAGSLLVDIRTRDGRPVSAPVHFSRVALYAGDELLDTLPLEHDAFAPTGQSHLIAETSNWGDPVSMDGRLSRPFLDYGQPYHKVSGVFVLPQASLLRSGKFALDVELRADTPVELPVQVYVGSHSLEAGTLRAEAGRWTRQRLTWSAADLLAGSDQLRLMSPGVHGSGAIQLRSAVVVDATGHETHVVEHGAPVDVILRYAIARPDLRQTAQILVAFQRDGVTDVCRYLTRDLLFDARQASSGLVRLRIPHLSLGAGAYALSVMAAEPGYYDTTQVVFYSINPGVYACLSRTFELIVRGGGPLASGTGYVVADGQWTLEPEAKRP